MRLVRHLTFSNVIAAIALFVALGGAAYAGSKINGKNIVNGSIGGGKLKKETITANKIKKGTITGAQIKEGSITATTIDVSTLATVPAAQTATTAQSANTAQTATNAQTAKTATVAAEADSATVAQSAKHAEEADNAKHAVEADRATVAGEAEKLGGKTAAELTLACRSGTEPYGGMCWDETTRPARFWLVAVKECGEAGGRLPTISELIAYLTHDGNTPGSEQTWSGNLVGTTEVLTVDDEENVAESPSGEHGYRCVFPLTN